MKNEQTPVVPAVIEPIGEHTPGPWRIASGGHNILAAGSGEFPKMVASVYITNDPSPTYKDRGELQANARLIAAAPDMLAALVRIATMQNDPAHDGADFESVFLLAEKIAREAADKAGA